MSGRFRFRPAFARLAAFAVALTLWPAGEAVAGPTVKKSRWVTWTAQVGGREAFGVLSAWLEASALKKPVCLPGEQPQLMRIRVVPGSVYSDDRQPIGPESLGTWRASVVSYAPDHTLLTLTGQARGADAVDLFTEAGLPWSDGYVYVTGRVFQGLDPALGSVSFNVEFTLTCGRTDVVLEPMR